MPRRIGLLVGDEESFSRALIERLEREADIDAELAVIGGTPERLVSRYDVLLDRMSHRIPHYRAYLKAAALAGARVVNDPMKSSGDDKFVALSVAARLGVPAPRAVLLPQKRYAPDIVPERDLKNLEYPLRWQEIVEYVGLPAILRSAHRGIVELAVVRDMEGLFSAFDASDGDVMVLQQLFVGAPFVRCVCVGGERMVPLEVDPLRRVMVHHDDDGWLGDELHAQLERDALAVSRALGFALNAVDMVVVGGVGQVVDASHPVPDLRRELLGDRPFERVIEALASLLTRAAHGEDVALLSCSGSA